MAVTGAGLAYYYQGEKEKKQQQGTSRIDLILLFSFVKRSRVGCDSPPFLLALSFTHIASPPSSLRSHPSLLSLLPS
jgi:hypothetical protein